MRRSSLVSRCPSCGRSAPSEGRAWPGLAARFGRQPTHECAGPLPCGRAAPCSSPWVGGTSPRLFCKLLRFSPTSCSSLPSGRCRRSSSPLAGSGAAINSRMPTVRSKPSSSSTTLLTLHAHGGRPHVVQKLDHCPLTSITRVLKLARLRDMVERPLVEHLLAPCVPPNVALDLHEVFDKRGFMKQHLTHLDPPGSGPIGRGETLLRDGRRASPDRTSVERRAQPRWHVREHQPLHPGTDSTVMASAT